MERRLAQLQAKGAVYLKTYQWQDQPVFEQRAGDDGARYEYKALRFKFGKADDAAGSPVRVELAPPLKAQPLQIEHSPCEGGRQTTPASGPWR